jgi:type I restriction enzyme M protein
MPLPPDFEKDLWAAADLMRANTGLEPAEYTQPVLALLFLRFADARFAAQSAVFAKTLKRPPTREDYVAARVPFLPPNARYEFLLKVPDAGIKGDDGKVRKIGQLLDEAMAAIAEKNPDLRGALPETFAKLADFVLRDFLKRFATIPDDVEGDVFGRVYEYFLGEFATLTLQKGGEFYTPVSVVRLIVEILEPYAGRIYDPACGSGGMFIQSARMVTAHRKKLDALSIYGTEKRAQTLRLCKLNLAVYGLAGQLVEANSYYDDPHAKSAPFDFVMANPPFNDSGVEKARAAKLAKRYPFGVPTGDNANYLWIQHFYSALSEKGRAGFVMANSASDARGRDLEVRKEILDAGAVDVMVSLSSNLFYTVTLPVTLWFFDRAKAKTPRREKVLFLDAREIYRQVDRAHRELEPAQTELLANVVRLYRGQAPEFLAEGSEALFKARFPDGTYRDIPGFCKVATRAEIAAQGESLNPGRYVGVVARTVDDGEFRARFAALHEELAALNAQAHALEETIDRNATRLMEA